MTRASTKIGGRTSMATMTIKLIPMLGEPKQDRLDSLRGCHALFERTVVKRGVKGTEIGKEVHAALASLLLADRPAALAGKVRFIIEMQVED
jgi:hypothetical protein